MNLLEHMEAVGVKMGKGKRPLTHEEKMKRQAEYNRRYRERHPEAVEKNRERARAYYYEHQEECLAKNKKYVKTHSLAVSDHYREYYKKHREKILAAQRERYRKKKEAAG